MKSVKHLAAMGLAVFAMNSQADVVNGSFEAGLAAWTCGGTVANCAAVGAGGGGPIDGVLQALIQTDPDGTNTTLSQTFLSNGNHIKFWWNFLTNEGTPSSFNDFATVTIDGITTLLADTNSAFVGAGGDFGFGEMTGYQFASLALGVGPVHTITFEVSDFGDSAVTSGLLIDAVVVPEPASLALLGLGLLGLGYARRRKQIA